MKNIQEKKAQSRVLNLLQSKWIWFYFGSRSVPISVELSGAVCDMWLLWRRQWLMVCADIFCWAGYVILFLPLSLSNMTPDTLSEQKKKNHVTGIRV